MIQNYGCDQEGRRQSWETGIEEVGFEVFLKDVTERLFPICKGKEFQRTGALSLKELEKCLIDLLTLQSKVGCEGS